MTKGSGRKSRSRILEGERELRDLMSGGSSGRNDDRPRYQPQIYVLTSSSIRVRRN